ncbi:MAG: pro-sigmaK processing inhibitor BofA family protein [Lachnospiraceae bacterium]|nr:pro-sigmaK processing inhibitor BofA family protein [Lachnospiraceae bacterium]
MERQIFLFMFAVGAVILLIICAVKGNMEKLIDFLMRGLLGMAGVHFCNAFLAAMDIPLGIGMNFISFLTIGFLGIPGFFGLYALGIYRLL